MQEEKQKDPETVTPVSTTNPCYNYSRVPNRPHGEKKIKQLENDIDIGGRAKEMCPNIKTIDTWLLYAA